MLYPLLRHTQWVSRATFLAASFSVISACSGGGKSTPTPTPTSSSTASVSSSSSVSISSVSSSSKSSSSAVSSSVASSIASSAASSNGYSGLAGAANFPIGVAVSVDSGNSVYDASRGNIVKQNFSQITAENIMKMSYVSGGNYTNADQLVDWASTNKIAVHGHALVWHPDYQLPTWAKNNQDVKNNMKKHCYDVARHFAGKVASWDVVNEALYDPNDNAQGQAGNYRNSVFYKAYGSPEYIYDCFREARKADANALLYYNDFNTEENLDKTTALVTLIKNMLNNAVPIDGVGFQMHVLPDWASIDNIKASWRKILDLDPNLKIKLTELDVRVNNKYANPPKVIQTCNNCTELQQQKQRYKDIVKAYLDVVPAHRRGGITIWGVADSDSWFAKDPDWPLLWNNSMQKKPAYDGVLEALKGL